MEMKFCANAAHACGKTEGGTLPFEARLTTACAGAAICEFEVCRPNVQGNRGDGKPL